MTTDSAVTPKDRLIGVAVIAAQGAPAQLIYNVKNIDGARMLLANAAHMGMVGAIRAALEYGMDGLEQYREYVYGLGDEFGVLAGNLALGDAGSMEVASE